MDRTRWQQLSTLLDEALMLAPEARAPWLAAWRERDAEMAAQLERMLQQADDDATAPQAGVQFGRLLGEALQGPATRAAATADTLTLKRCGAWQLLRKIGEGGMGQVWLAQRADGLYDAQAAIKLLRRDVSASALAARFARERSVLARLNHPAIARLLDAGVEASGRAFLVLEHVDGLTLAEHVRRHCPTVADRVRLMLRIAEGVEHAHGHLIVHRDLKPSNVLMTPAGDPKLLDFGIAGVLDAEGQAGDEQLTRQIGRMLTPAYAAPEQVKGEPIGIAADIFSLGVMLFELLCGELPFAPRDTDRAALEHALLHKEARRLTQTRPGRKRGLQSTRARTAAGGAGATPSRGGTRTGPASALGPVSAPQPLDSRAGPASSLIDGGLLPDFEPPTDFARVRGDLEAVVAKTLRKQPHERYGSVRALILDLERWLSHRPVSVRHDDWRHRGVLWFRRNALLATAGGGVALALLAGLGVSTWQWRRAEVAARQSEQVTQYLAELLESASPDQNGGRMPTVMQVLEKSQKELATRFADEPETLLKLHEVLTSTYHALNRFDIVIPMLEQRLALATRQYGADDTRTQEVTIDLARAYNSVSAWQRVLQLLEPMRNRRGPPMDADDGHPRVLYLLAVAFAQVGRFDDSQRVLDEAFALVDKRFPKGDPKGGLGGDFARLAFNNYVFMLRLQQGRLREAEALLAETRPLWNQPTPEQARHVMVLRRNQLTAWLRLGRYQDFEAPARAVQADLDQLLGRAGDMTLSFATERTRFFADTARFAEAQALHAEIAARMDAAGVTQPFMRLPLAAARLLSLAQTQARPRAELLAQARELLAAIDREPLLGGARRIEAWIALTRVALIEDDRWLAGAALDKLRSDSSMRTDRNPPITGRIEQLEGQLMRLQGNLPASKERLQRRIAQLATWTDQAVMPAWAAQLDLALTLVTARDPGARAALAEAATRRPPQLAKGHPFDVLTRYLQLRIDANFDDTAATREAWSALSQAYQRGEGLAPHFAGLLF